MRQLLYLALVIFMLDFANFAQSPPPPPLIYSAPNKNTIKKYFANEDNFEIGFAGRVRLKDGNQKGTIKMYLTNFKGSMEEVRVLTLEKPIESSKLTAFFESEKADYLKEADTELIYEKEITFKGHKGYEIAFKEGLKYVKARIFVIGSKVFELYVDVTNWHILTKNYKDKVKEFEDESKRFFESFKYSPIERIIKGRANKSTRTVKTNQKTVIANEPKKFAKDKYLRKSKVFISETGGFLAYFAARPKKRTKNLDNVFGGSKLVMYSSPSRYAHYAVTYFDTPAIISSQAEREYNIERQKEGILKGTKLKLHSEKVVMLQENKGKEFSFIGGGNTSTMRVFFIKQRMFRLIITTRGTFGKEKARSRRFNARLKKRFFDSFVITELPKPQFETVQLPKDFGTKIKDSVFSSSLFEIKMDLLENLDIVSDFETDFIKKISKENVDEKKYKNSQVLKDSLERSKILLLAYISEDGDGGFRPSVMITTESSDYPVFDPKKTLDFSKDLALEKDEKVLGGVKTVEINGIKFGWYETLDINKVRQRQYLANLKDLAFQVFLTYQTDEQLEELMKMFNSIRKTDE